MPESVEKRASLLFLRGLTKRVLELPYGASSSVVESHLTSTARRLWNKIVPADRLLIARGEVPEALTNEVIRAAYESPHVAVAAAAPAAPEASEPGRRHLNTRAAVAVAAAAPAAWRTDYYHPKPGWTYVLWDHKAHFL